MMAGAGADAASRRTGGRHSLLWKIGQGAIWTVVLVAVVGGGLSGGALFFLMADRGLLSDPVPDDGVLGVAIGGVGFGGCAALGIVLPLVGAGWRRGPTERLTFGRSVRLGLGVVLYGVFLGTVSIVGSQLGWLLPEWLTGFATLMAMTFSPVLLAASGFWEKTGARDPGTGSGASADAQ